jgi:tRNA threonylcarbamoyladenosine biosynthesis protein TsaB
MMVLGFDTATRATAVGLRLPDGSMFQARDDPGGEQQPGHATSLLPLASGLLSDAGVRWGEIERIAVGVGPGTFTGLRIGVATARGLAQSLGVALVGVSSLEALARAVVTGEVNAEMVDKDIGILALIDARRGEVFAAAYDGQLELLPAQALTPSNLGELCERAGARTGLREWIAVGDGALRYRDALDQLSVLVPDACSPLHRVDARAICTLGEYALVGGAPVVPDYRRRPDAEIALEGAAS